MYHLFFPFSISMKKKKSGKKWQIIFWYLFLNAIQKMKRKKSCLSYVSFLRSEYKIQNTKFEKRLNLILILNWLSIYCDHSQDGSTPAVVNEIGRTWWRKARTCLCKTLQLTVHVRENENHEVEETARRAQRQKCGKTQIWSGLLENFCCARASLDLEHSGFYNP